MNSTDRKMFELSFRRPRNFFHLDAGEQWAIDKGLGILDWNGVGMSAAEKKRYNAHYIPLKKKTNKKPSVASSPEDLQKENKKLKALISEALKMCLRNGPDYWGDCPKAWLARRLKLAVGIDPAAEEDHE